MTAPSIREAVARALCPDFLDPDTVPEKTAFWADGREIPAGQPHWQAWLPDADAALAVALPILREHYAGVADPVTPPGSTDYDKQAYDMRRNVAAAIRADEGPK